MPLPSFWVVDSCTTPPRTYLSQKTPLVGMQALWVYPTPLSYTTHISCLNPCFSTWRFTSHKPVPNTSSFFINPRSTSWVLQGRNVSYTPHMLSFIALAYGGNYVSYSGTTKSHLLWHSLTIVHRIEGYRLAI